MKIHLCQMSVNKEANTHLYMKQYMHVNDESMFQYHIYNSANSVWYYF